MNLKYIRLSDHRTLAITANFSCYQNIKIFNIALPN
jgi:hypothetical protein